MSFRNIFKNLENYSLKLDSYLDVYEKTFSKFRSKRPVILEIGIRGGGGVELLYKYFKGNCDIYGVDIDNRVYQINNTYPGVKIFLGDQADKFFMTDVARKINKPIDIVIDDGGHFMDQQINSFEALFPFVNQNGVYLVEDASTSFQPFFVNGHPQTFINYMLQQCNDVVNSVSLSASEKFSIEFHQDIVIVHKKIKPFFKLISCSKKHGYKEGFHFNEVQSVDPFAK